MDILNTITKDAQKVQNIENQLFDVIQVQLAPIQTEVNGATFNNPANFALYKSTGGNPLGVVGDRFTPQQPKVLFDLFLDGIRQNENLSVDGLKFTEMRDGQRIRFSVPVGKIKFTNLKGEIDESIVTLNFQTGFDGLTKTSMYLTTYRLVCKNGMKASVTEFECSFKNTKNNAVKSYNLIADIQKQLRNMETLETAYLMLNQRKVTKSEIDAYVEKVSGFKIAETKPSSKAGQILEQIYEGIEIEMARTGQTAYGLLQGLTYYTNHLAKNSENPDYIYLDAGLKTNDKAYKFAMELVDAN